MWVKTFKDAALAMKNSLAKSAAPLPPQKVAMTGVAKFADDATTALGRKLRDVGQSMSQRDSMMGVGSAASFAAGHGLEKAGKYLVNEGFEGTVNDLGEQVKKNPLPFIAVGIGLGFLIGRFLTPRRG